MRSVRAQGDTDEVRALRQQKAAAEDELEQAEQDLAEADAAITRAEAAFAAGTVPENALDVRAHAHTGAVTPPARDPTEQERTPLAAQDALNAKDAAQQAVEDAQGRVEAATVALEAALAERGETRKCVPARVGALPLRAARAHSTRRAATQALRARGAVGAGARQRARGVAPQKDVRRGRRLL